MIYRVDIRQEFGTFRVFLTADAGHEGITTVATAKSPTMPRGAQIRAWLKGKGFEAYGASRVVGGSTLRTMARKIA